MYNSRYIKAIAPSTGSSSWTRNPDWVALDDLTNETDRLQALFLVFEDKPNVMTIAATSTAANIDWGDGTSASSNGGVQIKEYQYSAVTGSSFVYEDGSNYKQVVIDITHNTGVTWSSLQFYQIDNTFDTGHIMNIVDLEASFTTMANFFWNVSNQRTMPLCERFVVHNLGGGSYNSAFVYMTRVRELKFPWEQTTGLNNGCPQSLTYANISGFTSTQTSFNPWYNSYISTVGDITNNTVTTGAQNYARNCPFLETHGAITMTACTLGTTMFYTDYALKSLGVLDMPSLTSIGSMFSFCVNLSAVEFTDCSNITTTTSAFQGCYNLSSLLMPNLTVGISLSDSNLDANAINAFFNSLGTASGTQTITISNNRGASTCDTSIATGKGFTVVA